MTRQKGEFNLCNLCEKPRSFEDTTDIAKVSSNVRRYRHEQYTVWRCSHCGSLHSLEAVDLDSYYQDYPLHKQTRDFAATLAFRNRLRMLHRQGLQKGHSLLDYGCGSGLFVEFLREHGFEAQGYDPHVSQFSDRTVLENHYEFVISQDVIEHADEPQMLLREYATLLKPSGTLLLGTPNASEIMLSENFEMELHQPYHRHILSERALIDLAQQNQLKLVALQRRFYYDTPFPMINTQFIKRYLRKTGGCLEAGFERPRVKMVLTSPELLFYGFFGYFLPAPGNLLAAFRKQA